MRTRLFVSAGIPLHDTAGDSLAPLQVYSSGRAEPGLRESTLKMSVPDDSAGCSGGWPDGAGWGDTDGVCGGDGDIVEVHPPEITNAESITARGINQRICITGKVRPA